jgi:hypothetical protein
MNATSGTEGRALGTPLQGSVVPGVPLTLGVARALPRAVLVRPFGPLKCPNSRGRMNPCPSQHRKLEI